jgi:hypothetical protein
MQIVIPYNMFLPLGCNAYQAHQSLQYPLFFNVLSLGLSFHSAHNTVERQAQLTNLASQSPAHIE